MRCCSGAVAAVVGRWRGGGGAVMRKGATPFTRLAAAVMRRDDTQPARVAHCEEGVRARGVHVLVGGVHVRLAARHAALDHLRQPAARVHLLEVSADHLPVSGWCIYSADGAGPQ
eukprot:3201237-Prymnesium_polylepis.1